jgi:F-type H+-transporting ATPase subunit c
MKKFLFTLATALFAVPAFAQEGAAAASNSGSAGLIALGAGVCLAVAALGGALGQGRAAAAALDGIARNPAAAGKIQTPLILSLAFIESLVIYALIIAFQLVGKF